MLVLPAIDLKDGKVVRLFKGRFDAVSEYSSDPINMAKQWADMGAQYLHVVDLDGAQTGDRKNQIIIKRIAKELSIPIETGGGIRSRDVIDDYLNAGINRVILGTKVVDDRDFLGDVLKQWNERIAVSLDCSNGFVAQRGWVQTSSVKGTDLAKEFASIGLKYLIYTDIAKDGTLSGPNIKELVDILNTVNINVIASGGVSNLNDIKQLLALKYSNLYGVITGKAIYEGTLDIKMALNLCSKGLS